MRKRISPAKPLLFSPAAAAKSGGETTAPKSRGGRTASVAPDPAPRIEGDANHIAEESNNSQRPSRSFFSRSDLTPLHISTVPMYPM